MLVAGPRPGVQRAWSYIVHLTSLFVICVGADDTSKSGKEPLCHCIDGLGGGYVCQLGTAGGNVEAEEVFHSDQVGSLNTRSQGSARKLSLCWGWANGAPQSHAASRRDAIWRGDVRNEAARWISKGGGLRGQDVVLKRGVLIPNRLLHVLVTMPNSVTLIVDPSLVAINGL